MQRNAWVADEIAQGFNAVVADAVGNEQGLFVADSHEAGRVPARRAVGTFGPPGRNRHVIPSPIDQNPWAHWRNPRDMTRHGWSTSLFQASQQWSARSSEDLKMRLDGRV